MKQLKCICSKPLCVSKEVWKLTNRQMATARLTKMGKKIYSMFVVAVAAVVGVEKFICDRSWVSAYNVDETNSCLWLDNFFSKYEFFNWNWKQQQQQKLI